MKIKLKFTEEHIALIKALNFAKLDIREIMNYYNFIDKNITLVEDFEGRKVKNSMTVGEFMDKYHITIEGLSGFDTFNLWGGTFVWEQMAYILGYQDAIIPSTKEDPSGPRFYDNVYTTIGEDGRRVVSLEERDGFEKVDVIEHFKDLDTFMITNLENIMDLLLQFCTEGIQPGVTYWAYDYQRIWHKEECGE